MDFVAGWFGGVAGLVVGHPFDTLKVRLQTDTIGRYTGAAHCLKHIVQNEGPRALYKGMASPMFGMAAINAIVFGIHGNTMRLLTSNYSQGTPVHSFIAGATAGGVQSIICCPMELVKARLQVQEGAVGGYQLELVKARLQVQEGGVGGPQLGPFSSTKVPVAGSSPYTSAYMGPWDAVRKIYGAEGVRGLNRGMLITLLREIPAFGLYFCTYDALCRLLVRNGQSVHDLSALWLCVAGGLSGVASWIITYPCDFIKSRIQTDGIHGPPQYGGIVDCVRKSYAAGRMQIFFKGLNATLLRAFPVNAVTFTTVALILRYVRREEDLA